MSLVSPILLVSLGGSVKIRSVSKTFFALCALMLFTSSLYTNCGDPRAKDTESAQTSADWMQFSGEEGVHISSLTRPVEDWNYPAYSLLPGTEAGGNAFSMYARRLENRDSAFKPASAFFTSAGHNVYNPNIIRVNDSQFPYRMYFFGWAKEACNTHLPYHPEHNLSAKLHQHWCDSTFIARGASLTGPWEVLEETASGVRYASNLQNPERWKPIVFSNNRSKLWDYHHSGDPSVIFVNNMYFMAYSISGNDADGISEHDPRDTDGAYYGIGGAYSFDGYQWIKMDQPLLISSRDRGFNERTATANQLNDMNFHRPSFMYDEGKFKLWFDYSNNGVLSMGYAELVGAPTTAIFTRGQWTIKQGRTTPAIANWPNPVVVKTPAGYFSYADPILATGNETGWAVRKVSEAFSTDGVTWILNGHLPHVPSCIAQVPEALYLGTELHLLYHCQEGSNRQSMLLRTRKDLNVIDPSPRICTPAASQSCVIPNGTGSRTCNSAGTAYGSCAATSCNSGFDLLNQSCVARTCRAPSATQTYITTSLTYFSQATSVPAAADKARQCYQTVADGITLLQQSNWECSRADVVASSVTSCVNQIKTLLLTPLCPPNHVLRNNRCEPIACKAPQATQDYLRTAVTYLEGATQVPKVAANARMCLTNLRTSLAHLDATNWPCAPAQATSDYTLTCIERLIKPALQ